MCLIKTVFHVHTDYSDDANASIEDVIDNARRAGVGCVAVTDHDTIEGAERLAEAAGSALQVIIGEEVSTTEGHVIGLFLHEPIEPGLSARRAAELVHRQGGLVVAPHPFNRIFGCSLGDHVFRLRDLIDIVEVCNAQNLSPLPDRRAEDFARRYRFPTLVGSDMHHRGYLDPCYQWLAPFDGPETFLAAIKRGHFVKSPHSPGYFVRCAHVILRERLQCGAPEGYGRNCTRRRPRGRLVPVPVRTEPGLLTTGYRERGIES